ncbi:MAG: DUF3150 domain-containing protein, partial [Phycisphaeraceae bacterium]|nr:DUF3150 domain-containing protein [Phycisphaeraceae bacterium]
CLTGGIRFLGGYAVPEERLDTVAAELDALGDSFAKERATFVAGYGQAIEDWIALHPQWEAAIRKAVDPASVVESRFGFGYQLYRIAPAENAGNLAEQVEGLGDSLFGEVARIARELDKSFVGWCRIDAFGRPVDLRRPSAPSVNDHADRRTTPRPASPPSIPLPDLS